MKVRTDFFKKNKVLLLFLATLILAIFLVYFASLFSDFIADDFEHIVDKTEIFKTGLYQSIINVLPDRPFLTLTLWLNYVFGDLATFGYKLTNILLHIIFCITGIWFFKNLIKYFNPDFKDEFQSQIHIYLAVLLFSVHGINNHVITSIVQRGVTLSGIFTFLSFILFTKQIDQSKKTNSHLYLLFSYFLFLIAILSKSNVIIYPVFLTLLLAITRKKINYLQLIPFFLISLVPIINYKTFQIHNQARSFDSWKYFIFQSEVIFNYIKRYLLLEDFSFYTKLGLGQSSWSFFQSIVFTLAFWGSSLFFLILSFLKRKSFLFLIFCFYLFLIPESSFFPINHFYFEHRNYLPFFFLLMGLFNLVSEIKRPQGTFWPINLLLIIYAAFFFTAAIKNKSYTESIDSELKFSLSTIKSVPTTYFVYVGYFINKNNFDSSRQIIQKFSEIHLLNLNRIENLEFEYYKSLSHYDLLDKASQLDLITKTSEIIKGSEHTRGFYIFFTTFLNKQLASLLSEEEGFEFFNNYYLDTFQTIKSFELKAAVHLYVISNFRTYLKNNQNLIQNDFPGTICQKTDCEKLLKITFILEKFYGIKLNFEELLTGLSQNENHKKFVIKFEEWLKKYF